MSSVFLLSVKGTHYDMEEFDEDWSGSGDVKYHLGTSMDRTYPDGRRLCCCTADVQPNMCFYEACCVELRCLSSVHF